MADELQGLLKKINEEGIQKASDEKDRIIEEAKKEAKAIVSKAKDEAETIRKSAEEDADKSEKRANATIQQAARDIILSLKEDLLSRLKDVIKTSIGEAMTPDFMGQILMEMVKNFAAGKSDAGLDVMINKNDLEKMQQLFSGSLVNDLKQKPEITIGHDFSSGLKIGFKGDDIFFDFSDDAIADIICSFIGPKLTAVLKDAKAEGSNEQT